MAKLYLLDPFRFAHAGTVLILSIMTMAALLYITAANNGRIAFVRMLWVLAFAFACFSILSATLIGRTDLGVHSIELHVFWLFRLAWQTHAEIWWYNIIGNIVLFVPFGFFMPLVLKRTPWWKVTLTGFIFSCAIELTQLLTSLGFCDAGDVFQNTWGTLLGYCMFEMIFHRFFPRRMKSHLHSLPAGGNYPEERNQDITHSKKKKNSGSSVARLLPHFFVWGTVLLFAVLLYYGT